jgi:4-amino-4-deoxy-L-arabinose transferase-like glycosyltransferase
MLAMLGMAAAPGLLGIGSFYSMNVFDVLLWVAAVRVLADLLDVPRVRPGSDEGPTRVKRGFDRGPSSVPRWLALGIVLGLGLLNKISVLWLGAGLAAGLLLTPARRTLKMPGPWLAASVAGLLFLPHIWWQVAHGWPTLEFIVNASREKMQVNSPVSFLLDQVKNLHPLTLPIWGAGLAALLAGRRLERYRALGIAFLAVAAILIANRTSRSIYLLPAFPMLMAAGAAWWESRLTRPVSRASALAVLTLGGALTAPLAVPILPTEAYLRYSQALGQTPGTEEKQDLGRLPQFFADRQDWPRFVSTIGEVWDNLTPEERGRAAVLTGNYGEAGAIELFGRSRGMTAISGHNNYWLWGPGNATGDVLIVLSRNQAGWATRFESVEQMGRTECGDCMPYENHLPILVCRRLHRPLAAVWPELKHFE